MFACFLRAQEASAFHQARHIAAPFLDGARAKLLEVSSFELCRAKLKQRCSRTGFQCRCLCATNSRERLKILTAQKRLRFHGAVSLRHAAFFLSWSIHMRMNYAVSILQMSYYSACRMRGLTSQTNRGSGVHSEDVTRNPAFELMPHC